MVNDHPSGWLETLLLGGRGAQSLTLAAILLGGCLWRQETGAVTAKGGFAGQQTGRPLGLAVERCRRLFRSILTVADWIPAVMTQNDHLS